MKWDLQDSTTVYNRWRALDELTGVFTMWHGKRVRLVELLSALDIDVQADMLGQVVVYDKRLLVKCKVRGAS